MLVSADLGGTYDVGPHPEALEAQFGRAKVPYDLDLAGKNAHFFVRFPQGRGEERWICLAGMNTE